MSILYFFIILLVLVIVHEYGHFKVAKLMKMTVEEFAFGFPPRIKSFIRKGTKFSFNLIPFGGYVKIKGEDGLPDSPDGTYAEGSFGSKSYLAQIAVLFAGVFMNFLLAWFLFFGSLSLGLPQIASQEVIDNEESVVIVGNVLDKSPAQIAGLLPGDIIRQINYDNKEIKIFDSATAISAIRDGKPMEFKVVRSGNDFNLSLNPEKVDGINMIGAELQTAHFENLSLGQTFVQSFNTTVFYTQETAKGFAVLFKRIFSGEGVKDQLSGPVGIVKQVGTVSDFGFAHILYFSALLSINLAILNLVPFPGLDGGRILFVLIEAITFKKVSQKKLGILNVFGFIILLGLMILITVKDIIRIW